MQPRTFRPCLFALVLFFIRPAAARAQDASVVTPPAYSTQLNNYVRSWEAVMPTTQANSFTTATRVKEARMTTQYTDGLGRPLQTVVRKGSLVTSTANPVSADGGKDLVSPVVYDEFGRPVRSYLPYASTTGNGSFKMNPFGEQVSFYNGSTSPISGQGYNYFYGKTEFEASPLNRVLRTYAPGDPWVKSGAVNSTTDRGVKTSYLTNTTADGVRIWNVTEAATQGDFGTYTSTGTYAAGSLYKTITEDEELNQVIEFKDKEGRVILKKVQITSTRDNGSGSAHLNWLCTYYIYDDLGQLRAVLQPRGAELLRPGTVAWNVDNVPGVLDEQFFRYEYDQRGRMIAKKVPGAGAVWMVYDARDRLVMSQDANMRAKGEWLYTQYDALNRPMATGLIKEAASNFTSFAFHRSGAYNSTAYPNLNSFTEEVLTRTFYDDYTWSANGSTPKNPLGGTMIAEYTANFYPVDGAFPYAEASVQSSAVQGRMTGTKTKILGTSNDYLYTAYYYDNKGRVIQVKAQNVSGGEDITTNQYSFSGQLLVSVLRQQLGAGGSDNRIATKNHYDELGRLIRVEKKLNDAAEWKLLSRFEYDALGQVEVKRLGIQPNGVHRTALNHDYNIRGWLLGINRTYLSATSQTTTFFGMDLSYEKNGYTATTPKYNGNIAGTHWRTQGDFTHRKYLFSYDRANRLLKADFTQREGSTNWTNANVNFNVVMGDGTDPATAYDMNGNIKGMQQWGLKLSGSALIDNLSYKYLQNDVSNRLQSVMDSSNEEGTRLGDFRTSQAYLNTLGGSKTTAAVDYAYDSNGNLAEDKNKDITAITYNHLNLPTVVTVQGKGTITYTYDAAGNKLKKVSVDNTVSGKTITTTTSYLAGAVYESRETVYSSNGLPPVSDPDLPDPDNYPSRLQFIPHEEGRIRYQPAEGTVAASFQWDYFIKDHLGNVRMVITEEIRKDKYPVASLEATKVATESAYYAIDAGKIVPKSDVDGLPTYTNDNGIGNTPSDPTFETANSQSVYKLNGNTNKTGLGILLKVMGGDRLDIHGKSYWSQANTGGSNTAPTVLDLLTTMLSAPTGAAAGSHTSATELNSITAVNTPVGSYLSDANRNNASYPNRPKAFINYLFFDEMFRPAGGGFSAVNNTAGLKSHSSELQNIFVPRNGYVYIYVSNESSVNVFFDNLQVVHNRGPVLEETHYYSFGLTMAGISSKTAITLENKEGFNGNELQNKEFSDGSGLEVYDFNARNYDPQVGRFMQVDPLSEEGGQLSWTTYHSFFNNPILRKDPTGMYAPIYDQEGNFLGTDDQGLQGKAIVMDKGKFQQGMKHEDAMQNSLGVQGLKNDIAGKKLLDSYNSLKDRPDYDGFVTVQEGIDWAKSHPGASDNPTPENTLYIDASKLDFGNITAADFKNGVGKPSPINLNTFGNFLQSSENTTLRATVYALGRVDMSLLNNNGSVKIINNAATDYDWNKGGSFVRKALINYERWRAGVNDTHGFKTFYYGTGKLNTPPTMTANYAKFGPYY